MAFSYPTLFLSENPTAGFAAYPHHVWTTAKPFDGDPGRADIEMRQVWVHGSYMRALEKDALKSALDIQQTLVGKESSTSIFHSLSEKLRSSTLTWGYHSPLMYWNNSHQRIDDDEDVLRTINDQSRTTSSSLNVALRPASVFAGKKFNHKTLVAADALVVTLVNQAGNAVGTQWQDRMMSLKVDSCENCTLYPQDGRVTRKRVYEFSFTPVSARENIALTFAYAFMAVYVLLSLRRLKAFHSKFGLVVTAITQMTCSILASFTICGILKINQSMIPQNAYPFVVLVMGIENMFRIINAVLAYPPTMATDLRIANALGDVGPVSVATAVQNIAILSLLARVVSPGVAAFCVFACIATLFDTFFLLTFFVAVLNVDIRRFELQDALSRANQSKQRRRPSPAHQHTWFDALVHGRLPVSTRMAGTAVTSTFILSLNYHFFEHREKATSLRHLFRLIKDGPPMLNEFDSFAPLPINASLTPGQWMRMQDFDTTKEIMRLAKPGADSFIVRVFAPLVVVLPGADRTDTDHEEAWTTVLRIFAIHHFYPVVVAVVFIVAFVAVLMNFLLYTEHEDEHNIDSSLERQDTLQVGTVALPHKLDIVKMAASAKGNLVSVGLDRTIAISIFDRSLQAQSVLCLPTELLASIEWPLYAIAIDDGGEWMACHCADDRVLVYCSASNTFLHKAIYYPDDNPPLLFRFTQLPSGEGIERYFIVLTSGARLTMLNIDTNEMSSTNVSDIPLLGASIQELSSQGRRLIVATNQAELRSFTWANGEWIQGISQPMPIPTLQGRVTGPVRIERDPEIGSETLIVTMPRHVLFLDSQSLAVICRLDAGEGEASLSRLVLGQAGKCPACGFLALRCAALVGDAADDCDCTVTTLRPTADKDASICLRSGSSSCRSFDKTQRTKHVMKKPGAWTSVSSQPALGLRRAVTQCHTEGHVNGSKRSTTARLRQRRHTRSQTRSDHDADGWEAYKLSLDGELETIDVMHNSGDASEQDTALYVSSAGPTVALDGQSVAVAFGNTVKIIKSTRRGSTTRRSTGRTLERQLLNAKDSTNTQKVQ